MQFQVCESDDSCQPGAQYTNPRVVVEEHHGAPLLNCSGLVLVRQLIERLGVARAIDAGVRVLRRCKWYRESDHILTLRQPCRLRRCATADGCSASRNCS